MSENENIQSFFSLDRANNLFIVIEILFFCLSVNSSCCWQLVRKRFQIVVFNWEWELAEELTKMNIVNVFLLIKLCCEGALPGGVCYH